MNCKLLAASVALYALNLGGAYAQSTVIAEALAFPTVSSSTPTMPYEVNIGGYPSSGLIPQATVNGFTSQVAVPRSFTNAPWPTTALSGYILSGNGNNSGNYNSSVALFGFSGTTATGANPYGSNIVITNSPTVGGLLNGGFNYSFAEGLEINVNNMKLPDGSSPSGSLLGLSIQGGSQVNTTGYSAAMQIYGLGTTTIPWAYGVHLRPGAASIGIQIDQSAWSGNNLYSQPIIFNSTDSNGVSLAQSIKSGPSGAIILDGAGGADGGVHIDQTANGGDALVLQRRTDTSPSGDMIRLLNAAKTEALFSLDSLGNVNSLGTVDGANGFAVGTAVGVSCSPSTTPFNPSTAVVTNGIITHC